MLEIREGNPAIKGHYVAYVNPDVKLLAAERVFLFWDGNRWGYPRSDQNYRGHVYGWLGPLPVMQLED